MSPLPIQNPEMLAATLALLLPFVAFLVILLVARRNAGISAALSIGAVSASLLCAVFLLYRLAPLGTPVEFKLNWLVSSSFSVQVGFLLDALSLWMLVIVSIISFFVQVYSLGYMSGDPGFSRYYAFQSLFAWAMMSLCVSQNMLQLYVFWELVGLSSYMLIGFWYEKFSATQAGKKAFVMTRLGDVAFFLGILLLLTQLGTLDILQLHDTEALKTLSPGLITLSAILIFGGIVGKSAQFPLLTWLPDAMEGPTPVSALLHSATMVAAGVYLFARIFPVFSASPEAMTVCLAIGTITLLLSSTMAMVARDIKQVWAYSTVSQLGFMIMGLAAGGWFAGVFHLTTHAGFKALLFLCSGMFIHAYETNDMFEIGKQGGRSQKVPMICMVIGAAALAGLPPLSGFFSKELILGTLAGLHNPVWLMAGLLGAFLTSYYTFRLVFIILFPRSREEPARGHEGDHHHHAGPYAAMAGPVILLALATLVLGFFQAPLEEMLTRSGLIHVEAHHGHYGWLLYTAVGLALAGTGLAWWEFGRGGASQKGFVERVDGLKKLFAERWYLDHMYRYLLDRFVHRGFALLFSRCDQNVVDGCVDGLGETTVKSGSLLSALQSGRVQLNLVILFIVLTLVALTYFF